MLFRVFPSCSWPTILWLSVSIWSTVASTEEPLVPLTPIASKSDFTKQVEKVLHEIEMVAVISEVIQQKDFEYHDDDGYRAYAAAMRDAAVKAREGATKGDYDGVRASVGAIKKSCDSCHADYRS